MKRFLRVLTLTLLLFSMPGIQAHNAAAAPCLLSEDCAVPEATGRQRLPSEMIPLFIAAGQNKLGENGPALPKMVAGLDLHLNDPFVPCVIMEAAAYVESKWKQYRVENYGDTGLTLVSGDCGYGVMQVTSGMRVWDDEPTSFDRERVAENTRYNIGTGALFMIGKWNMKKLGITASVGSNNPFIVEDWYYAVWAYNGLAESNNPNNSYWNNPDRPPFTGSQPRGWYPYQELVWGYAANPPLIDNGNPAWTAVPLSLPPRSAFPSTLPRTANNVLIVPALEQITPAHLSCLPLDIFPVSNFLPSISH